MKKDSFISLIKRKEFVFQNFYFYYIFILIVFLLIFIYSAFLFQYRNVARDFKFKRKDIFTLQESYIEYGANLLITYMDNFYDIYPNLDNEAFNKRALRDFKYKTKDYKNKFIFFKKDGSIVYKSNDDIKLNKYDLRYILASKKKNIEYKNYSLYLVKDATLYRWNLVILSDPDFLNREFKYVTAILKQHNKSKINIAIIVVLICIIFIILSTILLRNLMKKYFEKYEQMIEDRSFSEQKINVKNLLTYEELRQHIKIEQSSLFSLLVVGIDMANRKNKFSQYTMLKVLKETINRISEFRKNIFFARAIKSDIIYIYLKSSDLNEITKFVNDVQNVFLRPFDVKDGEDYIKASIIVALSNIHGTSLSSLIFSAENELKNIKSVQNSTYKFITKGSELENLRVESDYISNKIKYGFENNEFDLIFHKINYKENEKNYFEVFLNWNSPDLSITDRKDIQNLIDRSGLNSYVLEHFCKLLFSYYSSNDYDFNLIINISPIELLYMDLPTLFTEYLQEYNIDSSKLILDVDSTIFSLSQSDAIDNINRLSSLFRVSLDNYLEISNLFFRYLADINIDAVKFSKDIVSRTELKDGINKLIEFFALYNINVGVKNIDTDYDYEVIKDINFNILEGNYFQKVLTQSELEKYLQEIDKK